MELQHYKVAVVTVWVLGVCTVGITAGVTSAWALTVLAVVAVLPPIVMLQLWHEPQQSMSESIREARR
jgi:hypothetical protein